ncbi:hypothetical protein [Williamsia maris]|uniref:Pyridoxamine 5'-phosphate oxidase n=1 Tax=Williamsia maris TaxID=72806 RepID=A0ABT1H9Q5_9NOCA|nr:hypothetical protein [Williamsia maris]MCP2174988.1 hypothetical protein [Williamsia maris]
MNDDTATSVTAEDLELLRRPLHGFLSVAAGPIPAQPRPVWFEVTESGAVELFTEPDAVKVRRLRTDPTRADELAAILSQEQLRLVIHPDKVNRFRF